MKEDSLGVSMEVKPETPGTTEWALRERIKELTCLYLVSQELQKQKSLEELCPLIVEYLVPAMQFPEITVPVIKMGNRQFTTRKYSERLSHGLHAEIRLQEQVLGHLSVYYEEDRPFLIPEEQRLVNAIAEGLSLWSEGRQAEESLLSALEESRKRQGEIAALLEGSRAVLECR